MFRRTQLDTIIEEEWFDPYLDGVISRAQAVGDYAGVVFTLLARPCFWTGSEF